MQDFVNLRSLGTAATLAAGLTAAHARPSTAELDARWKNEVLPLVETYCHDCHGDGLKKGELAIDRFDSIAEMQQHRDVWKRIRDHIRHRLMPPPDEDQLNDEERNKILAWIDDAVFPVDPDHPDPGRVTLRRLNRIEYQNTLRDLLGVNAEVMELIPPDDSGYGFDNIGDVLTLSPAHMERYLEASRLAVEMAVTPGEMPRPAKTIAGREMKGNGHRSEEGHYLFTSGEALARFEARRPGRYKVTVTACGTKGAEVSPLMELKVDGQKIHEWAVDAPMNQPAEYSHELRFEKSGPVTVGMAFTNDFWDENFPDPARRDRNLMVNSVTITGPLDGPPPPKPESHRRILVDRRDGENDRAYALRVLNLFARKAFRRPPREGEVDRYLELVALAETEGVEHGIRLALEAMLVSPAFLYREEPQAEPDNADKIQEIDEHALATRLSYFFWSTMPDARLMDLAGRGELRKNLDGELDRLVRDPRSRQLVSNFTGQWLRLRDVAASQPARREFPRFNPRLREAMRLETEMLFSHVVKEDLPMSTLLDASFTFLNDDLARHYGIDGVQGDDFRRVDLADSRRHGILGHGSFHLLTSYPLRTSPVLRGKYVLENLLDTAPPPPPPNIPQLEPPSRHGDQRSLREQMEKHREDPSCSSCHALMDPIGFGLENFDASGAWRDEENGKPIDSSGELIDGRKFQGVEELRKVLVTDHRSDFHRSVASKLLTYALGRGLDWYDKPAIDRIVSETEAAGGSSRAMLRAVVRSVPFQYRRGDS
jgi:mono/diheme cytochrome c family protein